jgi:F-type H+-transporting ATPase subunit epsilon
MPTSDNALQLVIVTPERAVLDETADFVSLPMFDGELGVLPRRAPLIGRLGFGELRMRRGDTVARYFIDGGFTQVRSNVVTVLTPRAIKAEEINTQAASATLAEPAPAVKTPEAVEADQQAKQKARVQIRVAERARRGQHTAPASH